MYNMRAIHSDNILIYETKPGDILTWKTMGQSLSNIMLGTGYINDKLSREIFDGDIVTTTDGLKFEIVYEKEMFMFIAIQVGTYNWYPLKEIIKDIDNIVGTIHDSNIIEVLNEPIKVI